jgi:hypothetical protein
VTVAVTEAELPRLSLLTRAGGIVVDACLRVKRMQEVKSALRSVEALRGERVASRQRQPVNIRNAGLQLLLDKE